MGKGVSLAVTSSKRSWSSNWDGRLHKMKNKYNKSSVWSEVPCVCIRKDSVCRHSESLQHKEAISKEMDRERSSVNGGIQQGLYWLVQN